MSRYFLVLLAVSAFVGIQARPGPVSDIDNLVFGEPSEETLHEGVQDVDKLLEVIEQHEKEELKKLQEGKLVYQKPAESLDAVRLEKQATELYYSDPNLGGLPTLFCPLFKENNIDFILYNRKSANNPTILKSDKPELISKSSFNPSLKTKFVVHGWFQDGSLFVEPIKDAYLENGDYNVIGVNWMKYARCGYLHTHKVLIPQIGNTISKMIKNLLKVGSTVDQIHLIGHSFGAQASGFAGKYMKDKRIARISGLDPAGPLYNNAASHLRLSSSDAQFVDVIHTNMGGMGTTDQVGHVDFYPNGGKHQPACLLIDAKCSHQLSVKYFAESIRNPNSFSARKCDNYTQFLLGQCKYNEEQRMGEPVSEKAKGKFYLRTRSSEPYGLER